MHWIKNTFVLPRPGILLYVLIAFSLLSLFSFFTHGNPLLHVSLLYGGWLFWTLSEYLAHRFWMHPINANEKPESPFNHLYHHKHPGEIRVTAFHRLSFLFIAAGLLIIGFWLNPFFNLFTGFFIGFALYCFLHFWLHQEWTAQWLPDLHKSHILHHCKYPESGFGVSTTVWDQLFHTQAPVISEVSVRIRQFYFYHKPGVPQKKCSGKPEGRVFSTVPYDLN